MSFDPATLMIATAVTAVTVGALLIFAWAQNRSHRALAMWGTADLATALVVALLMTRNHAPDFISITLPFAIAAIAYGVIWGAGRAFSHRTLRPIAMVAGSAIWLTACAVPQFFHSTAARVVLISLISAIYSLATAHELWRDRGEHLVSRYPTVGCLVVHAGLLLARAAVALVWTLPDSSQALTTPWIAIMAIEPMVMVVAGGFLQLSMAKERTELVQRRAAATDELTGVASRRAFLDDGERRLEAAAQRRAPVALLLFDLDHFKQINDTHGHHTGDRVLRTFAGRAVAALRPGDLFGRIGGEEFAALLTDTSAEAALVIAERFRSAVESVRFAEGGVRLHLSVSVGLATAAGASGGLDEMLRQADRALYAAKSAGRNCVQQRRLSPPPRLRAV